jgi:TonB-dependent receptor
MRSRLHLMLTAVVVAATALIAPTAPANAQEGTVSGVVVDGLTGQPIRGATVVIEGTDIQIDTDLGGAFVATAPAGEHTVQVTKDGYEPQRVSEVNVTAGGVADFAVVLLPSSGDMLPEPGTEGEGAAFTDEIEVVATAETSTEAALLAQRKNAAQISDAIGTEEMSKDTGSDAADAVKRVTGISVQGGKYVYVRGLGERYSNTSLNGSRLPTTEFDKKVVPLDLFPAGLLDKVQVSKSYRPDKPGDFAAGLVELETLDFPVQPSLEVKLGTKSNSITTGEAFGEYGDGLGFFGSGSGQPLPSAIPSEKLTRANPFLPGGFTEEELEVFGEALVGDWTANNATSTYLDSPFDDAPYGGNVALTYGATYGPLGVVLSATNSQGYGHVEEDRTIFTSGGASGLVVNRDYDMVTDTESVRQGLVGNFNLRFGQNHKVELRTMLNDDLSSETRFFEGFNADNTTDERNYRVRFKNEEILSTQLSGEHFFEGIAGGGLLEWRATYSEATQDENLRETLYRFEGNRYILAQESQSAFLLYNDLSDQIDEYAVDWEQFFSAGSWFGSVKLGGAYTDRTRDFASRRFRFNFGDDINQLDRTLMPEQLLTTENIAPDLFELREETRATDTYTAEHEVTAVYAMVDATVGKWRFTGGIRAEQSEQQVITFDPFNVASDPIVSTLDDDDLMPSLSVVYKVSDEANLRAAVSETVNRPEFREQAPFSFTDVVGGRSAVGNPDLTSATIRSYDLRYEWFPSGFGVMAASLFYKDFTDPIERTLILATELEATWENVEQAENYGFELELRRDLGFLSESLRPFVAQVNYTYVDSEINVTDEATILTNPSRPLVGQPDSVYNLILEWSQPVWGTTTRILYNYTGEKIYEAGANGLPDVLEEPIGTLDLVWRQSLEGLAPGLGLKLTASNLTDETYEWTGAINRIWERGRTFGLSLSYTPF